ncbi:hypothetical protein F5X68DRAFT_20657 [Plectosphaerella plurivora]|uniref:Nucleotide-diphospho-sugar transferase domain-containing protein n=1 Tax=Plectosphaerella plurivora TaxID=936078 RepID=A0A9P9AAU7_9PEZI|nr:hypothetical protein F5X68DRAFT_20657 [Plectosphaerella plurivora]
MVGSLASIRIILGMLVTVTIILIISATAYYQNFNFPNLFRRPLPELPGDPVYLTDLDSKVDELRDFFLQEIKTAAIAHDATVYQPNGAWHWDNPSAGEKWPEPLGKKLCILDIDSRPFDKPGQIFGNITFSWNNPNVISGVSLGMLQHWMYAKIHNYTYYWVKTDEFKDGRRGSWKKPSILRRVLQKHPTCVFIDSDAIFHHLDLPFEWLLNYWGIDADKQVLAMSRDPDLKHNYDTHGKLYVNTGFMIAQSKPVTFNVLDDWASCPDEGGKFPNCTEWRTKAPGHPSDQGGFGNFIRYEYEDNIRELPCQEANGYLEHKTECVGKFIKHLWTGKNDHIKEAIAKQIPGIFLELFHKKMMAEKGDFYITEKELMSEVWLRAPLNSTEPASAGR